MNISFIIVYSFKKYFVVKVKTLIVNTNSYFKNGGSMSIWSTRPLHMLALTNKNILSPFAHVKIIRSKKKVLFIILLFHCKLH